MWEARTFDVERGTRLEVFSDGSRISFRRLFALLENEPAFASWYTDALSASKAGAFFWEHPALTVENLEADAEFVLISAPSLARVRPDSEPFRQQFDEDPDADVVAFRNLGGDAMLIVPCPTGKRDAYDGLLERRRRADLAHTLPRRLRGVPVPAEDVARGVLLRSVDIGGSESPDELI